MRMALGNGPVSWGIDYADQPGIPAWETVFSSVARAGYTRVELGPRGYVPEDVGLVRDRFDVWGLGVAGSILFERYDDPAAFETVKANAAAISATIASLGGRFLVIVPGVSAERSATGGSSDLARRLAGDELAHLVRAIDIAADIAADAGLVPALHPHAGSPVEFEDEIETVLERTSNRDLALCVDTGHLSYAGIDPAAFVRDMGDRVRYVHFKDLDADIHATALADELAYFDAVVQGVFCPIGVGSVDFRAVLTALESIGYDGPGTVEQDRRLDTPGDPFDAAVASLEALRAAGVIDTEAPASAAG